MRLWLPQRARVRAIALALLTITMTMTLGCEPQVQRGSAGGDVGDDVSQLTQNLAQRTRAAASATGTERARLIGDAVAAAKARAAVLRKLVEEDPARLLEVAVDEATRAAMPAEVRAHIERRVEVRGRLSIVSIDYRDGDSGPAVTHDFQSELGWSRLRFIDAPDGLVTGDPLRVAGVALGEDLVVDTWIADTAAKTGARSADGTAGVSAAGGLTKTGTQTVLVILVNFEDAPENKPYSAEQLDKLFFGTVNEFYKENTLGQTTLSGKTVGPFTLPYKTSGCFGGSLAHYDFARDAIAAARASGEDTSQYGAFFFVFPRNGCIWAGRGTIGGAPTNAWINGSVKLRTLAHELGHNFGMRHSHSVSCDDGVLGGTCELSNYGNVTDVMGAATSGHFNAFQKQRMGWLDAPGFGAITTVAATGNFKFTTYEAQDTQPKALRVFKAFDLSSGRKTYYYIEQRRPTGFDAGLPKGVTDGVVISFGTEDAPDSSYLLDMTPQTPGIDDAALAVGNTYVDGDAGVAITVVSADASGAEVRVQLGVTCERRAPEVTIDPLSSSAAAGETRVFKATITNRDSWACAATTMTLSGRVPERWSGTLAESSVSLEPGDSATTTLTVVSAADATSDTVSVSAIHGADVTLVGSASATATVTVAAPACTRAPPTISLAPVDMTEVKPGTAVRYAVVVVSGDSATCDPQVFSLLPVLPSGFQAAALPTLSLQPGASGTAELTVTSPANANNGAREIVVRVTHGADASLVAEAKAPYVVAGGLRVVLREVVRKLPVGTRVELTVHVTRDGVPLESALARVRLTPPSGAVDSAPVEHDVAIVGGVGQIGTSSKTRSARGDYAIRVSVSDLGESASATYTFTLAASKKGDIVRKTATTDRGSDHVNGGCSVGGAPESSTPILLALAIVLAWRRRRAPRRRASSHGSSAVRGVGVRRATRGKVVRSLARVGFPHRSDGLDIDIRSNYKRSGGRVDNERCSRRQPALRAHDSR